MVKVQLRLDQFRSAASVNHAGTPGHPLDRSLAAAAQISIFRELVVCEVVSSTVSSKIQNQRRLRYPTHESLQ